MLRVRFAPSPTGFLHVGSARTFIFNWLYARHNRGTVVLRLDDTDVERNTDASVNSIFDGLRWLDLGWDEEYKQSERLALHRQIADAIFQKGLAYRDFTPAHTGDSEKSGANQTWLFNPGMRELSRAESDRRAAAGESFALRFRVPRGTGEQVRFTDAVYGEQIKAADDIEDFALLRSDGMPTYHLASCADDIDLRISHIIRGQDHLSNTYKHVLIFEGAGAEAAAVCASSAARRPRRIEALQAPPRPGRQRHHLPRRRIPPRSLHQLSMSAGLVAKRRSQKMSRQELVDAFSLEGINRANAVINFKEPAATPEETFDPKAVWLNAEHIRGLSIDDLSARLLPIVHGAGFSVTPEKMHAITPLIRERIKLLRDVLIAADFFFVDDDQLPPYDPAELIPQKGDAAMALKVLTRRSRSPGANGIQTRSLGPGSPRRRPGDGRKSWANVPTDSSSRLRAKECAAAIRDAPGSWTGSYIGANRSGDREAGGLRVCVFPFSAVILSAAKDLGILLARTKCMGPSLRSG